MLAVRILRTLGFLAAILSATWAAWYFCFRLPEWENARELSCQSNLKQIRLSVMMYAEDHEGVMPSVPNLLQLYEVLWPYAKNRGIWCCPSLPDEDANLSVDFGWNYRLAGRNVHSLGPLASEPMLFDRKPWHSGKRNVITFEGRIYMSAVPVAQARVRAAVLRHYQYPSRRLNARLGTAIRWRRWGLAESLCGQMVDVAGDNPNIGPQIYVELIALQCKLKKFDTAEKTLREMIRKYPGTQATVVAEEILVDGRRGIDTNLSQFERGFFSMYW